MQKYLYQLFYETERQNVAVYGVRTNLDDDQSADFLIRDSGQWKWIHENNFLPYREGYCTCH